MDIESPRGKDRGFQTIGSLAKKIASSPSILASALGTLPSNSGTSGTGSQGQAVARQTGQLPGAIGAAELLVMEQAWQDRDSDALEVALYRSLKPVRMSLRPLDDADHELVGYERVGEIDPGLLETLRPLVDKIAAPAGEEAAARMITRLLTVTKSREPDSMDLRSMIAIMAEELAEFPPDVVATACRKWARQEKWWPSLSELRHHCQRAMRWRVSLRKAIAA